MEEFLASGMLASLWKDVYRFSGLPYRNSSLYMWLTLTNWCLLKCWSSWFLLWAQALCQLDSFVASQVLYPDTMDTHTHAHTNRWKNRLIVNLKIVCTILAKLHWNRWKGTVMCNYVERISITTATTCHHWINSFVHWLLPNIYQVPHFMSYSSEYSEWHMDGKICVSDPIRWSMNWFCVLTNSPVTVALVLVLSWRCISSWKLVIKSSGIKLAEGPFT
jgi:hypothetical protein